MKTYEFTFKLEDLDIYSVPDDKINDYLEDVADALYKSGCDDALFYMREGVGYVDFSRESVSLLDAIKSAEYDIKKADVSDKFDLMGEVVQSQDECYMKSYIPLQLAQWVKITDKVKEKILNAGTQKEESDRFKKEGKSGFVWGCLYSQMKERLGLFVDSVFTIIGIDPDPENWITILPVTIYVMPRFGGPEMKFSVDRKGEIDGVPLFTPLFDME